MIGAEAIGAIVLFAIALIAWTLAVARHSGRTAVERYRQDQAERRAARRIEARQAPLSKHALAPWPGPEPDRRATTGELLALSEAAETGDMASVRGEVARFFRTWDLHEWTAKARKRESAA